MQTGRDKTGIAAAAVLVVIAAILIVLVVFGARVFEPGKAAAYYGTPPPADATLWEKAEWERTRGNVPQCGWFADFFGPVVMYPANGSAISNISFGFAQIPGERPREISTISYTLSTRYAMKTVRYGDPSVKVAYRAWNRTPALPAADTGNSLVEDNELVTVDLDAERMGFDAAALGPGQRFVIVIVPEDDCIRDAQFRGATPWMFLPGTRMEITGSHP